MLSFPGLEIPGKKLTSWKTLEKSWNFKVVVLGSLEYINTTTSIAFGLVYCNAVTLKTDLVCALLTSCNHVCKRSASWKVIENNFFESWKTLEFGLCKSWKTVFNICTNPGYVDHIRSYRELI